ncbi:MAG TPA: hypothetical protein VHE37_10940, partial [Nevskiaceae bacterium]|nr:hypothetical protein [Nevskiaceae bacterium]
MPYATAPDGAQLYYEVHGSGPFLFIGPSPGARITPIRLLPRRLGPRPYIEAFSGDYRVIVMD